MLRSKQLLKLLAIGAIVGAFSFAASSAEASAAAPIRECGNYDYLRWTYGPIQGAGIYNLTTRNVSCGYARWLASSANGLGRVFHCRTRRLGSELYDTRCTKSGGKVIRFQNGS